VSAAWKRRRRHSWPQPTERHAADKIEALTARLHWAERDLIAAKAELQRMRKEVVLP